MPLLGAPPLSLPQLCVPLPLPHPILLGRVTQHLFKLLYKFSWLKYPTSLCR